MLTRRWYLVAASFDAADGPGHAGAAAAAALRADRRRGEVSETVGVAPACPQPTAAMAGLARGGRHGRRPLQRQARQPGAVRARAGPGELDGAFLRPLPAPLRRRLVGAWDFSRAIPTTRVDRPRAVRPARRDGQPAGARDEGLELERRRSAGPTGPSNTARSTSTRTTCTMPAGQADFALTVPDGMRSGVYAAHLVRGPDDGRGRQRGGLHPFFVRPPRGAGRKAAGRRPRSWCRPRATWPTPTTTIIWTARTPRC